MGMKVLIIAENVVLANKIACRLLESRHQIFYWSNEQIDLLDDKIQKLNFNLNSDEMRILYKRKSFDQVIYISDGKNKNHLMDLLSLNCIHHIPFFTYISSVYHSPSRDEDVKICQNWRKSGIKVLTVRYTQLFGNIDFDINQYYRSQSSSQESPMYDYIFAEHGIEVMVDTILNQENEDLFLYSNQTFKLQDIYKMVEEIQLEKPINYKTYVTSTDFELIKRMDHLKCKKFMLKNSFDTDFIQAYHQCLNQVKTQKKGKRRIKNFSLGATLSRLVKSVKPYTRNLLLFLLILYVEHAILSFSFFNLSFLYIMLMGLAYGCGQSILSALLVCGMIVYDKMSQGISILNLIMLNDSLVSFMMYGVVAILSGYYTDRRLNQIKSLQRLNTRQQEKYQFLNDVYDETYEQKKSLEKRIIGSKDSFAKVYEIMKELDSLQSNYILKKSLSIFETNLQLKRVCVYTCHSNYLRLDIKSNNKQYNPAKSINLLQMDEEVVQSLMNGKVYINRLLDSNMPAMIIPFMKDGKVFNFIFLEDLRFNQMNLFTQNKIHVMAKLIQASLDKAYEFEKATENNRYIEGTMILQKESLQQTLKTMDLFKAKQQLDYTILKLKPVNDLQSMSKLLQSMIRHSDCIGMDQNNMLNLILPNTSKQDSQIVLNRLKQSKGLTNCVVEDEVYA